MSAIPLTSVALCFPLQLSLTKENSIENEKESDGAVNFHQIPIKNKNICFAAGLLVDL